MEASVESCVLWKLQQSLDHPSDTGKEPIRTVVNDECPHQRFVRHIHKFLVAARTA